MPLLDVNDLAISFASRHGRQRAVEDVSFSLERGETLGIVGESGSGKSVSCLSLMGLLPKPQARIERGSALLDGVDLLAAGTDTLRSIRGQRISMIFQDPMTALNPYMRISAQLMEPLRVHQGMDKRAALAKAIEALENVGIPAAAERVHQFPHQFSGGMRQRVMIAMALLTQPDILIADEPTTALDVTVQAQILDLIRKLQRDTGTAVILVTHNLGVVSAACDRVLVMYAGRVLESGPVRDILKAPLHPYTAALRRSVPSEGDTGDLQTIPGAPPAPGEALDGCPFAPRCQHALPKCREFDPVARELQPGRRTACRRVWEGELEGDQL